MLSGRKPQPRPRIWASILAGMLPTVRVSCPPSRPTLAASRTPESATTISRWASRVSSSMGSAALASGWWGATAKRKIMSPRSRVCRLAVSLDCTLTPIARSARPEVRVSSVPDRMPSTSFRRVGGCKA